MSTPDHGCMVRKAECESCAFAKMTLCLEKNAKAQLLHSV